MKRILFPLVISTIFFGGNLFANPDKILRLKKTNEQIKIDGKIDPVWLLADSVSDFVQNRPYWNQIPTRKTTAKLLTTETTLYCIMICLDDEANIQKFTGKLDDFGGDVVSLMLDTFGDKRTAYKFAISASGVRADCRLLDDARNRDYAWDGVWFASSRIYDWGFVVEMEIPYKSIQYDEKLVEWGLDFDRWRPAGTEDIYWCPYEENEGQRISKFGTLKFEEYHPNVKGLNLEIWPVGITKASYLSGSKYKIDPNAGIDLLYNPSQKLTFQFTANPDFAQIEADPFAFNISRYETYYDERRPFFTQGNEVFMPSGRERNSGFYRPMELFYPRRIGKKLPDGREVPLLFGTKTFGRVNEWEYGGFLAMTGETDYSLDTTTYTETQAYFASGRIKKQILGNSSVGLLFVGKQTATGQEGVIDLDGAFRASDWQLSYQLARSYKNSGGDYAGSVGLLIPKEKVFIGVRSRYVGDNFEINQVGFVPWKGTHETVALGGPRWYYKEGTIQQILIYAGGFSNYEKVDEYTDRGTLIGLNMQFRNFWGYEININAGRSKDSNVKYNSYEASISSWFNISPKWNASAWGGYTKTYNFDRSYLAFYSWAGGSFGWKVIPVLDIGTSIESFIEGNPDNRVEDVTINSRPYVSWSPVNDLNVRVYVDNVYVRSEDNLQRVIFGFLFSYNFLPKSWIYFAVNDIRDRSDEYGTSGNLLRNRLHVTDRVSVFKLKYLYYF